jgi:hypothetical protein
MNAAPRPLTAGPVRLTLANGELRYLYVGQREIFRRIYFCVRFHDKWDTAPNEITRCDVTEKDGSFTIDLAARAVTGPVNYGWTARIEGRADGTIFFTTRGAALGDCSHIRRCGIQLLLGADAVIGQPFTMTRPDGTSQRAELQVRLDPEVLPMQFQKLGYTTRDGAEVSAEFSGTNFGYEDQRNFNDSSFKFFSAHAHTYPTLAPGASAGSSVTLRLRNVAASASEWTTPALAARVGSITGGARIPRLTEAGASTPNSLFIALNKNRAAQSDAKLHTWGFTPAVNLYDDETFMENTAAVLDQLRTARVFTNPHGLDIGCRLDPVHFESLHPRPARDARNATAFAAAWLACFVKYAAMGGAHEVAFRLGPGPVDSVRTALAALSGRLVRTITVTAPDHPPVEAFGIVADDLSTTLVFANTTAHSVSLPVANIAVRPHTVRRVSDSQRWESTATLTHAAGGTLALDLAPFEVCALFPE